MTAMGIIVKIILTAFLAAIIVTGTICMVALFIEGWTPSNEWGVGVKIFCVCFGIFAEAVFFLIGGLGIKCIWEEVWQ